MLNAAYRRSHLAFYGSAPAYQRGLVELGYGNAVEEIVRLAHQRGIPVLIDGDRIVIDADGLAELVCSNSFRSDDAENNAVGLLHAEMRALGSLIMACADRHR